VQLLRGDYGKAKRELGWEPTVTFKALVTCMVDADMHAVAGIAQCAR
jgi:GDPmannose 4,6-dehydratase